MDAEKVFYENVVQLVTKLGIPLSMCGHKYLCDSVVLSQSRAWTTAVSLS